MKSYFQQYHGTRLARLFARACELHFYEELSIKGYSGRIDLGTADNQYGIEIKSSTVDLKSGYGLNQESFEFGYVAAPMRIACQVIGYLYLNGMYNTGFIGITDDDEYCLVKPARANDVEVIGKPQNYIFLDRLCGLSDKIANMFYERNAIYKRG